MQLKCAVRWRHGIKDSKKPVPLCANYSSKVINVSAIFPIWGDVISFYLKNYKLTGALLVFHLTNRAGLQYSINKKRDKQSIRGIVILNYALDWMSQDPCFHSRINKPMCYFPVLSPRAFNILQLHCQLTVSSLVLSPEYSSTVRCFRIEGSHKPYIYCERTY